MHADVLLDGFNRKWALFIISYNGLGDVDTYLCTKRLLSRYARAVLSWYENRMSDAKSRLYFLIWRNERNWKAKEEKMFIDMSSEQKQYFKSFIEIHRKLN